MECKNCKAIMHKRGKNSSLSKVQVFVCPKCGTLVIIDAYGEEKWEPK